MIAIDAVERMVRDPGLSWSALVAGLATTPRHLHDLVQDNLPALMPLLVAKKTLEVSSNHKRAQVLGFKPTVERAAKRAAISPEATGAANAYRLLCAVMLEAGSTKLPYAANTAVIEVLGELGCLAPTSGSLRWYRSKLTNEPAEVHAAFGLPKGWENLLA